jgi:hypothetical protein
MSGMGRDRAAALQNDDRAKTPEDRGGTRRAAPGARRNFVYNFE